MSGLVAMLGMKGLVVVIGFTIFLFAYKHSQGIFDWVEKQTFGTRTYILERLDRSFESVIKVIDRLDTHSLEFNEKITYKNIKIILDSLNED